MLTHEMQPSKMKQWFSLSDLCGAFFELVHESHALTDLTTVTNVFGNILQLLISISLHFPAQVIIKYTHIHSHVSVHTTHTHMHTHIYFPPSGRESGLLRLTAPHCPCAVVCQLCLPPLL